MLNLNELQPSTIDALKNIHTEHRETIFYMQRSGTNLEKAIAVMILEAVGGDKNE